MALLCSTTDHIWQFKLKVIKIKYSKNSFHQLHKPPLECSVARWLLTGASWIGQGYAEQHSSCHRSHCWRATQDLISIGNKRPSIKRGLWGVFPERGPLYWTYDWNGKTSISFRGLAGSGGLQKLCFGKQPVSIPCPVSASLLSAKWLMLEPLSSAQQEPRKRLRGTADPTFRGDADGDRASQVAQW